MAARWISYGNNTSLFRQFRYLFIRSLTHQQAELQHLERKLHDMDQDEAARDDENLRRWDLNDPKLERKAALMHQIDDKLHEYGSNGEKVCLWLKQNEPADITV